MGTPSAVEVTGDSLRIVATPTSRSRADVYVYATEDPVTPIGSGDVTLIDEAGRARLLAELPEDRRAEADPLLRQLAPKLTEEWKRSRTVMEPTDSSEDDIAFPPIEPWPDEVDGAELLDEIAGVIGRFVVMPRSARDTTALWVVFAYAHAATHVSPMLIITSPEKRCGKTTLGTIVSALVPRPLQSVSLTGPMLYRTMAGFSPTLIVDEADTFLGQSQQLRGIINGSYNPATAHVYRDRGGNRKPGRLSTWGPKVIIGIGTTQLHSTLLDRSIIIELRRRTSAEPVESLRMERLAAEVQPVRRRAVRWVADNLEALKAADPEMSPELNDRAKESWRLMTAIAGIASPGWRKRAADAALRISGGDEERGEESLGVRLLTDIREFFAGRGNERAPTADLLAWLKKREDRPRAKWSGGKAMTGQGLAKALRPYGIAPKVLRPDATASTLRGYELGQFRDAFTRYLPQSPKHPKQASEIRTYDRSGGETDGGDVTPPMVA